MTDRSWNSRVLEGVEQRGLFAFAESFGCPATYVLNAIAPDPEDEAVRTRSDSATGGEICAIESDDGDPGGMLWFGGRGNLVILLGERARGDVATEVSGSRNASLTDLICTEIRSRRTSWRIALGPMEILRRIAEQEPNEPLLLREQVYYSVDAADRDRLGPTVDAEAVRPAERSDLKKLVEAALDLNEVDLNVPAWRVDRTWLRESVRRRMHERRTFVIGPVGRPVCKLDLGSDGPAGSVIEGVYTNRESRGRGLATRLTATVADRQLRDRPRVCLHVSAANRSARAAYERAGLRESGRTGLLLRNT